MNLSVVRDFFLFRTSAFQTVASHPAMLWLGPLMVLAAGFAREYDQEYLLAEPWFLVLPLVASVLGAFLLTSLLYFIAWFRLPERISWWRQFRSIAAMYWMTAPLAWCYAIPIEYCTSPYNAVRFNLAMLLLVAVYRVALMIRGVQVIYQFSWRRSTIIVMLFSDLLTLVALE